MWWLWCGGDGDGEMDVANDVGVVVARRAIESELCGEVVDGECVDGDLYWWFVFSCCVLMKCEGGGDCVGVEIDVDFIVECVR